MPRKGRRRIVGKWATVEQETREEDLTALQRELHATQRRDRKAVA